ncbi:MAG: hypothetical protein ACLQM8_10350 [Limisphaerales bacterium]
MNRVPDVTDPGAEFTVFLWAQDWGRVGIAIRGTADRHAALAGRPPL